MAKQVEPDGMSPDEVRAVVRWFVDAAVRAKAAGFDGVLFDAPDGSDAAVIAITGIHGNFYSNPFYVNFGETLNSGAIDEDAFLERFEGGAAMEALEADLRYKESLGIWALPAFLVEHGEKAVLIRGVADEAMLEDVIDRVSS